jgi:anti-sigma factor RsiW
MDCREFKTMIDSFISDELLVETNHEVLAHLETCPDCAHRLSERRALLLRIRHTLRSADEMKISPAFAARMTADLRTMALRPSMWERLVGGVGAYNFRRVPAAFACVMLVALGTLVWIYRSDSTISTAGIDVPSNSPASDLADAIRVSWNEIASHAVGDHANCAIEYNLGEEPIPLEEAAKTYGAYNKDLDKNITAALNAPGKGPNDVQFIESHSCVYEGRRFAHIVYKQKGRIVSFLVTDTDLPPTNDEIQTAEFDGNMNSAGFRIGHHAVFVVSDLTAAENASLARFAAPAIRSHLERMGA